MLHREGLPFLVGIKSFLLVSASKNEAQPNTQQKMLAAVVFLLQSRIFMSIDVEDVELYSSKALNLIEGEELKNIDMLKQGEKFLASRLQQCNLLASEAKIFNAPPKTCLFVLYKR